MAGPGRQRDLKLADVLAAVLRRGDIGDELFFVEQRLGEPRGSRSGQHVRQDVERVVVVVVRADRRPHEI
jgi:hypothetical protein